MPDIDHQHDAFLVAFMNHFVFERVVERHAFAFRPPSPLRTDP
jgi:hypothetical protein